MFATLKKHKSIVRTFIKAEVIKLLNYLTFKNEAACRNAGKIAIEGKGYEVQDGDVIHFKVRT